MIIFATPSRIASPERLKMAEKSLESLKAAYKTGYNIIVTDSSPDAFKDDVRKLYYGYQLIDSDKPLTNTQALHKSVKVAFNRGFRYVFVHLDDGVYLPILRELVLNGMEAMDEDRELYAVHFSGPPIIDERCVTEKGNQTLLKIDTGKVSFDTVQLKSKKFDNFTLWNSKFVPEMISGAYYPLPMWSTMYRTDFLLRLFETTGMNLGDQLDRAEIHLRSPDVWTSLCRNGGKLGYVNMQFGGFEMHRNTKWEEIIKIPNNPVL